MKLLLFILPYFFSPKPTTWFSPWLRWDGPHYLEIAQYGYQASGETALFIVFYPLYPALVWLSQFIFNNFYLGAIFLSTLLSFTASIILFELTLLDFNRRIALLSVWFLNIFPTAYFLQAPYTESLYLTTSLLTFYFYRKKSFLRSGIAGALTTLTRVNGILLLPALLTEIKSLRKNFIALFLTPVGFAIYLLINYMTFKDPFYFSKILSSHWYKYFTWPWASIHNLINFYQSQKGDYYWLFFAELASISLIALLTIFVYFRIRKSYGIYMLINLFLFTSTSFVMSTPRYALILFPIFISQALIKNRLILFLISIISLVLLCYLTYLFTQGRWAY